jgi:hypothetical protein
METNIGHIWRTFALLARRIPRRTSRPAHSHAGTLGTSSKADFSNVTISLRSIRDRDHEAGYTNNAAQPSVPISGKTLSGTITRPMTAMSLMDPTSEENGRHNKGSLEVSCDTVPRSEAGTKVVGLAIGKCPRRITQQCR